MNTSLIQLHIHSTPCGNLILGSYDRKLCLCDWESSRHPGASLSRITRVLHATSEYSISETIASAITQLDEYFDGKRISFQLPLLFIGTSFQISVWNRLMEIPYGSTVSYSTLASMLGRPTAVRAVANANGANPISIIAPCHRVIGSDGSLTGYGGGIDVKRHLLRLEAGHITHKHPINS